MKSGRARVDAHDVEPALSESGRDLRTGVERHVALGRAAAHQDGHPARGRGRGVHAAPFPLSFVSR